MPAVRAAGLSTIVPVIVLERSTEDIALAAAEGASVLPGSPFLSV